MVTDWQGFQYIIVEDGNFGIMHVLIFVIMSIYIAWNGNIEV